MADYDHIADRTVVGITALARTAKAAASMLLVGTGFVTIASFLLLVAITDGGARTVAIVFGGLVALVGVGAATLARWRFSRVERDVPELAKEVRSFLGDQSADGRDDFIEAFVVDDGTGTMIVASSTPSASAPGDGRASSGFGRYRQLGSLAGRGWENYGRISDAITSVTAFPGLALLSISIAAGFAVFTFFALIIAALS